MLQFVDFFGVMKRRGSRSGTPLVPERIGRYEVLLPIASGGMGTVYLSRSRGVGGFQREVALKVMHAHLREEEHFATDLIEEAKLAVRIQHPNVVQVLDVGEDPHGVFLVMEYIEGESLAGLQRAGRKADAPIPERIGIRILADALLGLHAAHELRDEAGEPLGLVHRDFSPQNILVGIDGISKLTDFGIAKARSRLSHTATGLVKGKIHYMSPEQARTEEIDRRCDVWAGGVMVWETLAGCRLYKERADASILLRLITEPPPRLRTVNRDIPQALEDVVAHALATDVQARCPTAKRFADELLAAAEALGGVASQDEVAVYIRETSGMNLAKRRAQVGEVVKLRREIKTIARESTVDTKELTTSPAAGVGIAVPTTDDDDMDTTLALSDPPAARREDEQTNITHSSPAIAPPQSRRTVRIVGMIAALAVGGTAAYVLTRAPQPGPASATGSTASAAAVVAPAPSAPGTSPSASAVTPKPSQPAPPTPSTSAVSPTLTLTANAAIAVVTIGKRTVLVDPPETSPSTPLEAGETTSEQVVVCKAVDGRIAKATLPPGGTSVTIRFPPMVRRPGTPRPVPTAAPLATNPHQ